MRNKLLFILPAALALSAFAPWAITPLLMIGGAYLAFEATEKIWHALKHDHPEEEVLEITDPAELEARQVGGAVRTDFILSAEIMAIALGELDDVSLARQSVVLTLVAVAITVGVYGAVGLIVKMDDIGLHQSQRRNPGSRALGHGLLWLMPRLLSALSLIGTAAMLWVGGGIFLHGLEEFHLTPAPAWVHDAAHAAGEAAGGAAEWFVQAAGSAIVGLVVGGVIVVLMHLVPRKEAAAAH